jgi:hypothetical protein
MAVFESLNVGQHTSFQGAIFSGPVIFTLADIAGQFNADKAKFDRQAFFKSMKVGQIASSYRTVFKGPLDLRFATIQVIDLSGVTWPPQPNAVDLEG